MSDMNGQESISVSFYNSLLGVGSDVAGSHEAIPTSSTADQRHVRMPDISNDYGTMSRLIDETDARIGRSADQDQNVKGLTRRLAEMFEQKQELVSELKAERIRFEKVEAERDDLQRQVDGLSADYEQALAKVEQTKAARERAAKFMEEAKEATRKVISESRLKVSESEEARAEAERAYEDEHNLRRNLEQLLQEMKSEGDAMGDKVTVLAGELKDANRAKDEAIRKLEVTERDLESLRAENEAHVSRIDHLTGRNELLARNLQSINVEHGELRKQFDATAVSHAALSADYEALVHRCSDAEAERDRLRIESIERSGLSNSEANAMRQELVKARDVIVLLRPIIQKAGIGDLRKGDIRALDERLAEYEQTTAVAVRDDGGDGTFAQRQAPSYEGIGTGEQAQATPYQQVTAYDGGSDATPAAPGATEDDYGIDEIDAMTTADLYAALDLSTEDFEDDPQGTVDDGQVESVSFVDMFGKTTDGGTSFASDAHGAGGEYDFDKFEDFDDLDEPDGFTDYEEDAPATAYGFDISDIYGETAEDDFAFPQDLKKSDAKATDRHDEADADSDDDFGLENLSDFNSIMANFAHYNAEEFGN